MKFSGVIVVVFLAITIPVCAAEIPREPLDTLWEMHMLAGTNGAYYDGVPSLPTAPPPHASFESANGNPDNAWPTTKGIRIDDFKETRLWGLLRKGGWRMEGGLLAHAIQGSLTIELYGKSVWKTRPSLFHFGIAPPRSAEHSYEFFLLRRPREGMRAVMLKKWTIPPDQIPYNYYLRGTLQYDAAKRIATVKVTDVDDKRVFLQEPVDLSDIVGR